MNVLKNIREIRVQKRLSQEFIADKLGMTTSNYSRRESGQYEITLKELAIIANVFEMDMIDILTWPAKASIQGISSVSDSELIYNRKEAESCENCKVLRKYILLLEEKIERLENPSK